MDDFGEVVDDGFIGETEHSKSNGPQERVALPICLSTVVVDTAVDFDDQPALMAVEVSNEASDHLLSSKAQTVDRAGAKRAPQPCLRFGKPPPKLTGALQLDDSCLSHTDRDGISVRIQSRLENQSQPLPY